MIYNVTLVRLISTFTLVAYHARVILMALGFGEAELDSMRAGTDLFIVCSAFLTVHVNRSRPMTGWTFLRKRVLRIVPLYWLMTLVVAALALLLPMLFGSTHPTFERLLKSLFFIPYLKDSNLVQPIVYVAWTLNLIMLFSIIYALSIAVAGIRAAWVVAMLIVACLVTVGQAHSFTFVPLQFYTDLLLIEFVYGLGISLLAPMLLSTSHLFRNRSSDLLLTLAVGAFALSAIVAKPYLWVDAPRAIAFGIPCAILLAVAIRLEAHGYAARASFVQRLAGYSYAIYLSHFFATALFSLVLTKFTSGSVPVAVLLLAATLFVSALVGMALNQLIERPLVALLEARDAPSLRHRIAAWFARPSLASGGRARRHVFQARESGEP